MSVVAIHQPNYMPWIGFFHKFAHADVAVLLDSVQFPRRGVTHRNYVLGPQGPLLLTVPVASPPYDCPIADVAVADHGGWAEKHFRSLEHCYRKAPFWADHAPFLRSVYLERPWALLADLNETIIRHLFEYLAIRTPLVRASALGGEGAATDLLIDLTRRAGGSTYLSGPSGRTYMHEEQFARAGIGLVYHTFEHPVYAQGARQEFVPRLSALDLVMHEGPASRAIFRAGVAQPA
jgi:hypothetical protein